MFSGQLPSFLDVKKLADQGAVIEGETTVGALPRLGEFKDSLQEPVRVALRFSRGEDGARTITGTVSTRLALICQRCLGPVMTDVVAHPALELVWSEDQSRSLPESAEPYLVTDEKMPLADLLEEELLLALPLVALHDQCPEPLADLSPADDDAAAEKRDNPFAILAQLKKGQSD